jgi:hypothetical protein
MALGPSMIETVAERPIPKTVDKESRVTTRDAPAIRADR